MGLRDWYYRHKVNHMLAGIRNGETIDRKALARMGNHGVKALIDALRDKDADLALRASINLQALKDPKAIPLLLEAIKDEKESEFVRVIAFNALGGIRDPQAVSHLMDSLDKPILGALAVTYLGRSGDARAVPIMIGLLCNESRPLREKAAEALAELAKEVDVDLGHVSKALQQVSQTIKQSGNERMREHARAWIAEAYMSIAESASQRKRTEISGDGVLLQGNFKGPKTSGDGTFRQRRISHG